MGRGGILGGSSKVEREERGLFGWNGRGEGDLDRGNEVEQMCANDVWVPWYVWWESSVALTRLPTPLTNVQTLHRADMAGLTGRV